MSATGPLPIVAVREALREALREDVPMVVAAPTGSGKSTQLPGWIAEDQRGPVLVVEPRRVACRALADWVARLHGTAVGQHVGYRVRFEDRIGPRTQVWFTTPGVALNLLADDGAGRFAAVMVDEFHERSWEIDLVVTLLLRARARGAAVRLLLCSATLDTEALVARLGARLLQAEGRRYPVDVVYQGEGIPTPRDLELRVAAAVDDTLRDGPTGDLLVFLPGKGEIERCGRALAGRPVTVCPVHGGLPPQALVRAFESAPGRRVFLATNVAETSLTLPGVTTVIDSGLVRRRQHQAGHSVLALVPISRASMDQRAGRAGRVAPGRCIRLWGERVRAEPVTPPELVRVSLDDLVLRAAGCGLPASELSTAPWVDPPPAFALNEAIERLRQTGALDARGQLTAVGKARARLPVSAFSARMLVDPPPALAGTVADLVALVELGRDLLLPGRFEDAEDARRECFGEAVDEVEVQLRALRRGRARREGLHPAALTEARKLASSLRQAIGAPPPSPDEALDRDALVALLLARIPEAAFVPRARADKKKGRGGPRRRRDAGPPPIPWGNGVLEVLVRPLWIPGLSADEQPTAPEAGLLLDLEWLGHGRAAQGRGRLLLRCTREHLWQAGLGEPVVGTPRLERGDRGRHVVADMEQRYAGVVIHHERAPLRGAALCDGVASLVLEGRLRKGLGESLRDALHLWALVEQSGQGEPQRVPDARGHLCSRLLDAGLDALDELDLLEPEDLCPDVDARALALGLTPRQLQALRDDFPRRFVYQGNVYACHVELAARRVTLEAERIHGRGGGEPPVGVLPRFRGFAVFYRKASRQLRLR
ncbi:MAG: helicase-related protein [Myxococcota bacterium]